MIFITKKIGSISSKVFKQQQQSIGNLNGYIEEMTENKIAVIEMSSHQLEFTKNSPDVSILTNIYEEHLEHYKGGMTGYVNSKLNIVRYQNENNIFIYYF